MVQLDPGLRTFVITGLMTTCIVVSGIGGDDGETPVVDGRIMNPELRVLLQELRTVRTTWHPRERERLLDRLREQPETWVRAVRLLTQETHHPYAPDGIALLGELADPDALALARELARSGHPKLRPHAVLAATQLEPWPVSDLLFFLEAPTEAMRRAAVAAAAGREDPEIQAYLCTLLEDPKAGVMQEAAMALPDPPAPGILERMERVVRFGPMEQKAAVLEALGRPGSADRVAGMLVRFLNMDDPEITGIALSGLEQLATLPDDGRDLWSLAADRSYPLPLRCRILALLEQHPLPDDSPATALARVGPPEIRYHAIRVLLIQGEASAIEEALRFVREGRIADGDEPFVAAARATESLLRLGLGCSSAGGPDEWEEELVAKAGRPQRLPPTANLFQKPEFQETTRQEVPR